jgi:hypothetical protein
LAGNKTPALSVEAKSSRYFVDEIIGFSEIPISQFLEAQDTEIKMAEVLNLSLSRNSTEPGVTHATDGTLSFDMVWKPFF